MNNSGHWNDKAQMLKDKAAALKMVKQRGIILSYDSGALTILRQAFRPVFQTFKNEIYKTNLSLIYTYWQSEQPKEWEKCDGCFNFNIDADNPRTSYSAIGISGEALYFDRNYTTVLIIHELTHLFYFDTCNSNFFRHMDKLLERYNAANGTNIQNDYNENGLN